jgi:hypothetical protein
MDHIISMYIDNEMSLNEKIEFVKKVKTDNEFSGNTIDLLEQEKTLRSEVVDRIPQIKFHGKKSFTFPKWRPMALFGSALAAALILWLSPIFSTKETPTPFRFVINQPNISQAEITGSFTKWQNIPMKKVGDRGYWEITLDLPKGEHRFVYILDGQKRLTDPTLQGREKDDFGGENSILCI